MSKFLSGLLLGIGMSFLLAPVPGKQLRRILSEEWQQLLGSLPQNAQPKQATQQVMSQASQTLPTLKDETLEMESQGTESASQGSGAHQQTSSKEERTENGVAATAKRAMTSAQQGDEGKDKVAGDGSSAGKQEVNDPLSTMQNMSPDTRAKLEAEGIYNTPQLLEHSRTKEDRAELAHKVGMSNRAFKEFVYHADFMRLEDVGEDGATLLEEAGVNGCKDLQQRNPEHLHTKLIEVQESKNVASTTPTLEQVIEWIAQAKQLTQAFSKEQEVP